MSTTKKNSFTLNDTLISKGFATILLLWHHLFYETSSSYNDYYIEGVGIINTTGIISKVCVAIFVILSGYGLAKSFPKNPNIPTFYLKQISKIFINYWFIWIIFIPISVLFFNITFNEIYGENYFYDLLKNFFGIQRFFNTPSYNPTWWFISAILLLYLLFPLLYFLVRKTNVLIVIISIFAMLVPLPTIKGVNLWEPIRFYLFPFVLGIYAAENNIFQYLQVIKNRKFLLLFLLFLIIFVSIFRQFSPFFSGMFVDGFLGFLIISTLYVTVSQSSKIGRFLIVLGNYSMDIFLFHTFIYYLWFPDLIYFTGNPLFIFLSLFCVSIIIAIILDKMKVLFKIDRLSFTSK